MNNFFNDTRKLTFMGVMLALTIVFVMITAMPNITFSMAVVMFIPTILTGIILGPVAGGIMGFFAGVSTLLRALLLPVSPTDIFFINPLVSVIPRITVGIAAYYIFTLISRITKQNTLASGISGALSMLINTIGVIGMLYVVFGQTMVDTMGGGFVAVLGAVFLSNGIIEMISALIIVPIAYSAYTRYLKMR